MVVVCLVPLCPLESMTSVAAINCLVASGPEKAKLDPVREIVYASPTEPSLANPTLMRLSLSWRSGRGQLLNACSGERD